MIKYTFERRCIFIASKDQKFNKYSDEFKNEILLQLNDGASSVFLSKKYNISRNTICTWQRKRRKQGNLADDIFHNRGRKKEKNLTIEDYKERYEILKKYQAFLKAQREEK